MGYTKATVTFEDKNELLNACVKHVVLSCVAEEIYSFKKGRASFGVLEFLSKYPSDGIIKTFNACRSFCRGCEKLLCSFFLPRV